jgi:predicted  nucleic acid-binding Zn-ribbon protein
MQDIDAKAKSVSSSTSELTQDELDAAEAAKKMGEEQKKAFEAFQGKLLDVRDSVRDLADDIKTNSPKTLRTSKRN